MTIMGKGKFGPSVSANVAIGALAHIVIWRCIGSVACLTIRKLSMAESDVGPSISAVVTVRTLRVVMVRRCVVGVARPAIIWQATMFDISPVVGIVAVGALTAGGSMPGRTFMARLAVGVGIVIKSDIGPVISGMAIGALSGPVTTRCFMA